METQDKETSTGGRPALIFLPVLILLGLALAPPTRSILKTQCTLLFDSSAFASRLRDLGVKNGPLPTAQKWEQTRPAEIAAQLPDDYPIQLVGALLSGTDTNGNSGITPQAHYAYFLQRFGTRLTALSQRFPNRPGPYAHFLRLMTQLSVRVSRDGELIKFQTVKTALGSSVDRQVGCAESWAAFDNAAAQGEKLDPDNAYFPMMRAIGLFDAKRDAEGIAAVLRAGQKKRFDDYSLEEPEASWALYQRTYGANSVLLRESNYAAVLLPHFAALRSVARLTVAKAAQAERDGRPQEGLALRHAMMQCAVLMREHGSLICALVGNAIFSQEMHTIGAVPNPVPAPNATNDQKHAAAHDHYLAYLRRIGQMDEAAWVDREDATNQEVRKLAQDVESDTTRNPALQTLPGFWITDMLLLANTLGVLAMCGLAVLLGRPQIRGGEKLLPWVVLVILVCWMIVVFQMQWAESLIQMRIVLDNLSFAYAGNEAAQQGINMSEIVKRFPGVVHVGEVLFSLVAPLLPLIFIGATGLIRKEPFSAALGRGLQRGALVFTSLLAILYALTLITTARLESQANAALDARTHNAIAYLRQQKGSGHTP